MTRAQIYKSNHKFTVLDTRYNTIVLQTASRLVAQAWADKVDECEHPFPYDILAHGAKAHAWEQKHGKPTVE